VALILLGEQTIRRKPGLVIIDEPPLIVEYLKQLNLHGSLMHSTNGGACMSALPS
jgi:hypothetical protein